MLSISLRSCKYALNMHLKMKNLNNLRTRIIKPYLCICQHIYNENVRIHSTQTEHHRQKVVIETTTPKIVIEKLELEKVLQDKTDKVFWRDKIDPYIKLARWDRPIGVYLLFYPCAWSIALGSLPGELPPESSLQLAGLFLAGAGLMRGAGCTINDMWDKDIDKQVERTKDRPLSSGKVTTRQAAGFLALQLSLALGILLQLNCYSVVLGASSMLLVVTYPLAKRFTNYPQLFLGATFNWGALLGYSAVRGELDAAVCCPLYVAALAWTVIYDTIYAHQDKLDDLRIGMKSTALTFGRHTKPALGGALTLSAGALTATGLAAGLGWPYHAAVALAVAHIGRQIYTLNVDNPSDCADKFKSNSWIGLIILGGIVAGGLPQYARNRARRRGAEHLPVTNSCVFS